MFIDILKFCVYNKYRYTPYDYIKDEIMDCRSEETNKRLLVRLKRIEGQVRGIHKMVSEERECIDIMIQIESAVSALKGVWEIIAANHLEECLINENNSESKRKTVEQIVKHMKDLR